MVCVPRRKFSKTQKGVRNVGIEPIAYAVPHGIEYHETAVERTVVLGAPRTLFGRRGGARRLLRCHRGPQKEAFDTHHEAPVVRG